VAPSVLKFRFVFTMKKVLTLAWFVLLMALFVIYRSGYLEADKMPAPTEPPTDSTVSRTHLSSSKSTRIADPQDALLAEKTTGTANPGNGSMLPEVALLERYFPQDSLKAEKPVTKADKPVKMEKTWMSSSKSMLISKTPEIDTDSWIPHLSTQILTLDSSVAKAKADSIERVRQRIRMSGSKSAPVIFQQYRKK
jgi:hypothetical protein